MAVEAEMAPMVPVTRAAPLQVDPPGREGPVSMLLRRLGRRQEDRVPMAVDDRRRIIGALYSEGRTHRAFVYRFGVLMAISVAIAVLGLVSDSTAVVIGAMLVAPLLTPTLGMAAAVVMGWPRRIVGSALMVGLGSAGAIGMAAVLVVLLPFDLDPLPAEMLARTHPNLLDLGIAVGAGAAGTFAIVRRQAADAMSGAAVAVALVPPLSTVGAFLAEGEWDLAWGALLLFGTNVAGVLLAGSVVFVLGGFVPGVQLFYGARRTVGRIRWIAVAVVVIIFILNSGRSGILQVVPAFDEVEQVVEEWKATSDLEVVDIAVDVQRGEAAVQVVVATTGTPPAVGDLAGSLAEVLDRSVDVELQVVQASTTRASANADE
jgi:uncharacterized hydrophobic protein (TIGR00271 family)